MVEQPTNRRTVANQYIVGARIKTLGHSDLYRGTHAITGRVVALREFAPADMTPLQALGVLTRMAAISSRFLVDVADAGELMGARIYVAHPLLHGESLRARLARKGTLRPAEAASLAVRMLKGLDALHKRGLVHGGLRPSQVFHERIRDRGWHVRLLGAGMPLVTRDEARASAELAKYAPPEWLCGEPWTRRSDVWCVAAVVYECIAGRSPFAGASAEEIAASTLAGRFAPLGEAARDVTDDLAHLVAEGIAPDPEARPAGAGDFMDRLLALFPEAPPADNVRPGAADHWAPGAVVVRANATTAARVPVESTSVVARKRRSTVLLTLGALAALGAVATLAAMTAQGQHREQALRARLAATSPERRAAAPEGTEPRLAAAPLPPDAVATHALVPRVVSASASATDASAHGDAATARPAMARPVSNPLAVAGRDTHAAATPSQEAGVLEFWTATPCEFALDGSVLGTLAMTRINLAAGPHRLACHAPATTQQLAVPVRAGRRTRVRITTSGEAVVTVDLPLRDSR